MKTLLLLRHAKSSWEETSLPDHDRPLKPRGIKAAKRIGSLLASEQLRPELVLCSTATRARETLRLVLKEADLAAPVEYTERLYHCSPEVFVAILQRIQKETPSVMLVGHNPGMEEFLTQLTGQPQTMPTGALAHLELDLSQWSEFNSSTRSKLIEMWRPRDLKPSG